METTSKKCTKCNLIKEFKYFNTNMQGKYNLTSRCKSCINELSKEYRAKNIDIILEKQREHYSHNKEIYSLKYFEYKKNNSEKIIQRSKKYRNENRDKINKKAALCRKTPESMSKAKVIRANRRAKLKNAGRITAEEARNLIKTAKVCYWCDKKLDKSNIGKNIHLDHYIPLAKGGDNTIDNIVVSCSACNLSKGAKEPTIFANSIGKLL